MYVFLCRRGWWATLGPSRLPPVEAVALTVLCVLCPMYTFLLRSLLLKCAMSHVHIWPAIFLCPCTLASKKKVCPSTLAAMFSIFSNVPVHRYTAWDIALMSRCMQPSSYVPPFVQIAAHLVFELCPRYMSYVPRI